MRLLEILRGKPRRIVSLPPTATTLEAARVMAAERIGAVVVLEESGRLAGVLSERDLALGIASHGARLLKTRIGRLMTVGGPTASPKDTVAEVVRLMTRERARHVPVLDGARLVGVVSVGDLLKARLGENTEENAVLQDLARAHAH
jgi:CBS domain-containing protein